jgi:hypothetical protein
MHKRVLMFTTSVLILASGAIAATAQGPMTPQPDQQHTQHHPTGQKVRARADKQI